MAPVPSRTGATAVLSRAREGHLRPGGGVLLQVVGEAVSPSRGGHGLEAVCRRDGCRGQYFGRRNHSALARFAQNTITRIDTTQMTRPSR